jgi:hypothetical protein
MGTSNRNGEMPRQGSSDEAGSLFFAVRTTNSCSGTLAGSQDKVARPDCELELDLDLDLDPGLVQEGGHVTHTTELSPMPILPRVTTPASAWLV